MNEIVAIVEGETEQTFVRDQLAAHLGMQGTAIWAVLPGKHRRHGGVKKWPAASQDIVRTLCEHRYCTTMFDFYGMPADWPGRSDAARLPWEERAHHVEQAMLQDITQRMGSSFDPRQFLPYVQLHEFEALAFADVTELAAVTGPISRRSTNELSQEFKRVVDEAGDPEAIDDGYETCPSRQIQQRAPAYRKRLHGPIVTGRIGLGRLREACRHFASWVERLEALGRAE